MLLHALTLTLACRHFHTHPHNCAYWLSVDDVVPQLAPTGAAQSFETFYLIFQLADSFLVFTSEKRRATIHPVQLSRGRLSGINARSTTAPTLRADIDQVKFRGVCLWRVRVVRRKLRMMRSGAPVTLRAPSDTKRFLALPPINKFVNDCPPDLPAVDCAISACDLHCQHSFAYLTIPGNPHRLPRRDSVGHLRQMDTARSQNTDEDADRSH